MARKRGRSQFFHYAVQTNTTTQERIDSDPVFSVAISGRLLRRKTHASQRQNGLGVTIFHYLM